MLKDGGGGVGANEGTGLKATEDWEMETRISSLSEQEGGTRKVRAAGDGSRSSIRV